MFVIWYRQIRFYNSAEVQSTYGVVLVVGVKFYLTGLLGGMDTHAKFQVLGTTSSL